MLSFNAGVNPLTVLAKDPLLDPLPLKLRCWLFLPAPLPPLRPYRPYRPCRPLILLWQQFGAKMLEILLFPSTNPCS